MKKLVLTAFLFFISITTANAAKVIDVEFDSCVDGDTAKFIYKKETITARFLAIDTPETKHPKKGVEPFGPEASEYTCNKLKSAKEIKLEFDDDSDELDKYDRYLVWVFVDGNLLQKELVSEGLASVAYLYGDYKYTEELELLEQTAEENKIGIWSVEQENNENQKEEKKEKNINDYFKEYKGYIIIVGCLIIICIGGNSKTKGKAKNKLKREIMTTHKIRGL